MADACRRCPNKPIGCFPDCLFPSPSWASNNTSEPPPQWVIDRERELDEMAAATGEKRDAG